MALKNQESQSRPTAALPKDGLGKVIGLSIITLGIYGYFWYNSRVAAVNALGTPTQINPILPQAWIGCVALNIVAAVMHLSLPIGLVAFGVALYMCFQMKSALEEHAQRAGRPVSINPVMLFFFQYWYLESVIDKL